MPSNFFGLYSPGSFLNQANFSISSASLPSSDGYRDQPKLGSNNYPTTQLLENENRLLKMNEAKNESQQREAKTFKLSDKTLEQANFSESDQANLYYAVVDMSGGNIYLFDQVTKDNYPPPFNQTKQRPNNVPINNVDMITSSPALNYTSWTSPPLNTNALLNYPLFNNALTSFGFGKNQFSPNINLFQESPKIDTGFFNSTPKIEGKSSEWTPETMNRPIFSNLGMKQRLGMANSRGDTPPEVKFGTANGAFLRRMNDKTKPPPGNAPEGLKYSSPSSFLQTSQSSHINRSIINNTTLEKM